MTMLLKAMGSDERCNKDLVHVVGMPPNPSIERTISGLRAQRKRPCQNPQNNTAKFHARSLFAWHAGKGPGAPGGYRGNRCQETGVIT